MSSKKNKPRTGRGLDALLGGASIELASPGRAFSEHAVDMPDDASDLTREINLDLIDSNPWQPRTQFDEETLAELAQSVRELGVITPITLRKADGGRYQIISGERRCKAAAMADLTTIPAYVIHAQDRDMQIMALVENIQRTDLNPIDIAAAFHDLIEKYNLTQEKLSEIVGKNRASITNYLRLLKLPPEVQQAVRAQHISMGHAKVLMGVDDADMQKDIARSIRQQDLSVRQVEDLVKTMLLPKSAKPTPSAAAVEPLNEKMQESIALLKEVFDHHLSGRASINHNTDGTTRIVLNLKTDDDVQFILTKFMNN
jgi:ParB family chromosome partitioning protein